MTSKLQKTYLQLNFLIIFCAMAGLVYYDLHRGLWLKGVTSAWFVVLGSVNLIYARKQLKKIPAFLILTVLGLFFGMCADVLLGISFLAGLGCFAFGHVLYLAAFYALEKFRPADLCFILPVGILSVFFVTGLPVIRVEDPIMEKLIIGYAIVIACMLGKAISNFRRDRSLSRLLIMVGSLLFWFSDLMLAIDMFGTPSRLTWILCSYAYWPAQNILAFSLYHHITERHRREINTNSKE